MFSVLSSVLRIFHVGGKAVRQIDAVGSSNDDVAQHPFLIAALMADFIQHRLQTEDELQDILKLGTEIVIGYRIRPSPP